MMNSGLYSTFPPHCARFHYAFKRLRWHFGPWCRHCSRWAPFPMTSEIAYESNGTKHSPECCTQPGRSSLILFILNDVCHWPCRHRGQIMYDRGDNVADVGPAISHSLTDINFPVTQNIFITFIQRRPNVFDFGAALYKCYINVLCLLGYAGMHVTRRRSLLQWRQSTSWTPHLASCPRMMNSSLFFVTRTRVCGHSSVAFWKHSSHYSVNTYRSRCDLAY